MFDLDTYINQYTGHTKLLRLMFIAQQDVVLAKDALTRVLKMTKEQKKL
jgi:hypothetical protein